MKKTQRIPRLVLITSALFLLCTPTAWASMLGDSFIPNLPNPPANDREEAALVASFQSQRTLQVMQLIKAEATEPTDSFFYAAAGVPYDFKTCPRQMRFTMAVATDLMDVLYGQKKHFSRLRPHQVLPQVSPAIEVPWHASYPSGHATQSRILAQVFAAWYPDKASTFDQLARRIAHDREIAGLHYPSDSAAGMALADQVFVEYMKNPDFQEMIKTPCVVGSAGMLEAFRERGKVEHQLHWIDERLDFWKKQGDSRKPQK
jgi:membrane-associated phospholipid phosphatase